jgi:D-psicose/D-tagatose/L-ribulose 3-epimerase
MAHRLAVCNELFQNVPLGETCGQVRALGYEGLEIAPFTLLNDPATLSPEARRDVRETIARHDLQFVGFHWLLAAPEGLHATTRDEQVRKRTWDYVNSLIDLCADLAGSHSGRRPVLVFGSPKQRSTTDGVSPREAVDVLTHGLAHAAPRAESRGVTILIEALSPDQADVVTCLSEAVSIVKQIRSAAIQTMFDTHNARHEAEPHAALIRKYAPYIQHVHVNEMDGREPGTGNYDFAGLLGALEEVNYQGWVSVEAFDLSRDAREVAARAIETLTNAAPRAAAGGAI